jgi:hypothetical protein
MNIAYYFLSVVFILAGFFICWTRWVGLYLIYINKSTQKFSMVSFLGGGFICIGLFILQPKNSFLASYWWLGIFIDPSLSWEWVILFFNKFSNLLKKYLN